MSNTYTQIHIHFVFAVKYRKALIQKTWKDNLYRYITTIFQDNGQKVLQINGTEDHIHILIGLRPDKSIAGLIQKVKSESTKWIRAEGFAPSFAWQGGYGAFAYSKSHVMNVIHYIQNQEIHHRSQSFLEEYRHTLNAFGVEWDEQYIFTEPQ